MRAWKYFEMPVPRPDSARVFTDEERDTLEALVSMRVASILEMYGIEDEHELDVGDCIELEDPITYRVLSLDEIALDDDSELVIGQLPFAGNDWDVRPGIYSIQHNDEDGVPKAEIAVHDLTRGEKPPIHYTHGTRLELDYLQELHEALGIIVTDVMIFRDPVSPPNIPTTYPFPAPNPEFESVVAGLGDLGSIGF